MPIRLRRASIGILLGLAVITLTLASAVAADCEFVLGFKALRDLIGHEIVGECLENEHFSENGDSTQATTGGLLVWRNADNHTAFTDGNHTWINGPNGLQQRLNSERFPREPDYAPGGGISTPTPQPASAQATRSSAPHPTFGLASGSPWPGPCASFTWEFQYSTTEEASAVTGYQISRRKPEVSGEDTFSVIATVSDTSYQECGLEDGVLYEYEIRPKNAAGVSALALTLTANGSSQTPIDNVTPTPTPTPTGPLTPPPTPTGPLTPPPTPTPTPVGPPPPPPPTPTPTPTPVGPPPPPPPTPTPTPTPVGPPPPPPPTPTPTPTPTPVGPPPPPPPTPTPTPTPVGPPPPPPPTPTPTPLPTPIPTPLPTPEPTPTPATPPEDADCEYFSGGSFCVRPLTPEEWDALSPR